MARRKLYSHPSHATGAMTGIGTGIYGSSEGGRKIMGVEPIPNQAALYGAKTGAGVNVGTKAKVKGYKKGGKVKKTGLAKVHKGERVLNKKQTQKFEKAKKQFFGIKKYGAH